MRKKRGFSLRLAHCVVAWHFARDKALVNIQMRLVNLKLCYTLTYWAVTSQEFHPVPRSWPFLRQDSYITLYVFVLERCLLNKQ